MGPIAHHQRKSSDAQLHQRIRSPGFEEKLPAYRRMAQTAATISCVHGALEYRECKGEDLMVKFGFPFPQPLKLKAGETVVLA